MGFVRVRVRSVYGGGAAGAGRAARREQLDACVADQCSSSSLIGQLAGEKGAISSRAASK